MKRIILAAIVCLIFAPIVGATEFGTIGSTPTQTSGTNVSPVMLGLPFTKWIDNIWLPTAGTAVSYTIPTDGAGDRPKEILISCDNPVWVRYAGTAPAVPTATSITDGSGSEYQPVMRMPVAGITAISIMPTISSTVCSISVFK
jgi:hypothetical protein